MVMNVTAKYYQSGGMKKPALRVIAAPVPLSRSIIILRSDSRSLLAAIASETDQTKTS